jgi:hypothetical protein
MPIEIDQSNKVEQTNKDTILAFSDGQSGAVIIPAGVKRRAFKLLKGKGKTPKIAGLIVFAAGLILLLRDYIRQGDNQRERIIIDTEYTGQDATIRGMMIQNAYKLGLTLEAERLVFYPIGKKSNAHKIAWGIQRGQDFPAYIVTLQDLEKLL